MNRRESHSRDKVWLEADSAWAHRTAATGVLEDFKLELDVSLRFLKRAMMEQLMLFEVVP
jgi:hypothetical protein